MAEPMCSRFSQLDGKLTILATSDLAPITPTAAAVLLEMLRTATRSKTNRFQPLVPHMVNG
jgi:hypothetical protein